MLAKANKPNILDQNHLVVFLREQLLEMNARVLFQALKHLGIHAGHAVRGLAQPIPIRVFSDSKEDLPDGPPDTVQIDRRGGRQSRGFQLVFVAADVARNPPLPSPFKACSVEFLAILNYPS